MDMESRKLIKVDKNGTKYWNTRVMCDRCVSGSGTYMWGQIFTDGNGHITGASHSGTCFKCGGAGYVWEVQKEYTPEHRAKLDAANEKRKAKQRAQWEAKAAEREAQRAKEAAERAERERIRFEEIERNRGHFIGQVGDKIEMTVTLTRTFQYEVPRFGAPWSTDLVTGYVFKTDDNNTLVWKTVGGLRRKVYTEKGHFRDDEKRGWYDYEYPEEGERVTIKGTIKAHEEYNNVNQTVLNRVKWVDKKGVA
jgi:predicted  nucleic acid-binding Zn-ribbon protein